MPKQHTSSNMHSLELELPMLPPLPAYIAQNPLGRQMQAALALAVKLPDPEPEPLQLCDAETFMVERFAGRVETPEPQHEVGGSNLPNLDVSVHVAGVCPADKRLIKPMLLPPFTTITEIRNSVAAEAYAACMPIDAPACDPKQALADLAGGVTFLDLLSADQVPSALRAVLLV